MTFIRIIFIQIVSQIIVFNSFIFANDIYKIVQTDKGLIRGQKSVTLFERKNYYSYKGIPYAKPPVDKLRFKPPQLIDRWDTVRDAIEFDSNCLQINEHTGDIIGSEDCLYLNIYVPDILINETYPVMIFIHGGAYYYGSGDIYRPDFFIEDNVILVTFNYRLGIFGYFSMGTREYPGNMGLKDQLAAIKWIHQNIEYFNGNKHQITLFGESVGAASIHMHLLSQKSNGLFQKVILQSGTSFNVWSYYLKKHHCDLLPQIVKKLGLKGKTKTGNLEILKTVSPLLLINATRTNFFIPDNGTRMFNIIWAPVIEDSKFPNSFLTKYPEEYLLMDTNEQIDLLIGHTAFESYFDAAREMLKPELLEPFDKAFQLQLPFPTIKIHSNVTVASKRKKPLRKFNKKKRKHHLLKDKKRNVVSIKSMFQLIGTMYWPLKNSNATFNSAYKNMTNDVRDFYFPKNIKINKDSLIEYRNLIDDFICNYAQYKAAMLEVKRGKNFNLFYYIFSMVTDLNVVSKLSQVESIGFSGATHTDDLFYMFRMTDPRNPEWNFEYEKLTLNSIEFQAIKNITKIWTNFAKLRNSNTDFMWKPVTKNQFIYANLTNDGIIQSNGKPYENRMNFWDNLYQRYKYSIDSYSAEKLRLY